MTPRGRGQTARGTRSRQEGMQPPPWIAALRSMMQRPLGQLSLHVARYVRTLQSGALTQRLPPALAAHLPERTAERLTVVLVTLWLLEAFVAVNILLAFVAWLAAPPSVFGGAQGPGTLSLFVATVVLPGLILLTRRQRQRALELDMEQEELRQMPELERACRLLYIQPYAPLHIAQAAYAAAMKKHHPDVAGGDDARARELNWAIETFREHSRPEP